MTLLSRGSWPEARRVADILRTETVGGLLLLGATILALAWANSPWVNNYQDLAAGTVGPAEWHLDLSLSAWAADGLPAILFFVAGLELKREFVAGDLRDPRRAALPAAAAVGGMAVPALIYAAGQHSRLADQVAALGPMPGSPVSGGDAAKAAAHHRDLARRFSSPPGPTAGS
ncbi:hypothetical protein GCM10025331_36630 [Actinoplanes utahensis]|uniref:Sodium:proton antiporter n=1 Tax=Actinoplanes utahensis TaxID=1869 RepID=A0A0A6UW35_ACTUT|nr:hypothetical protein MB27_03145 [Actinoplanes utahensis]GIF31982.1 hypothetical protein Aut01nite_49680 [Actinoplanes utahensis]